MSLYPDSETIGLQDNTATTVNSNIIHKTYKFDTRTGEIRGMIDKADALYQFIWKAILTPRFRHIIYSSDYGCELWDVIGISDASDAFIQSEIKRTVKEALIYDSRIKDVRDIEITQDLDAVYISCTVETVEGIINFKEVIV